LIENCKEYIVGLSLEFVRQKMPIENIEEKERSCEMAAYLTHCKLKLEHEILTLENALESLLELENCKTSSIVR
jgi:coatomer protein complex subunit alpha (xenin)